MYTYFYWYYDKKNRLYYHGSFRASSPEDACIMHYNILKNKKRMPGGGIDPTRICIVAVLTSLLHLCPEGAVADDIFILACVILELTCSQINLMLMLRSKMSYKKMADEICVSVHTVRKHLSNAYAQLGESSRDGALNKIREQVKMISDSK